MEKPAEGSAITQAQINASLNLNSFPGSTPGKNWHEGLFEPWAMNFGYPSGKPIYASVSPNGYHIYFLNDKHQAPIILKNGETPQKYGIQPNN